MRGKTKKIILSSLLVLFLALPVKALDPVVVSSIDATKNWSHFGGGGAWSVYCVEAEVRNFMKTGIVHVVLQAVDPKGNKLGQGEIVGYIKHGYSKKIKGKITIFGRPQIDEWRVLGAYIEWE